MTRATGARRPDVVVVGGGVVGLSVAHEMAGDGATVCVIDESDPGTSASFRNAGWVVPSMSGPVPSPASLKMAARYALRSDGPLTLGVHPSTHYVRFLIDMLRFCTPAAYQRGLEATAALARMSIPSFERLRAMGASFESAARGVLMLCLDDSGIDHHLEGLRVTEQYGCPPAERLTAADVIDLEPRVGQLVRGGILTPGDQHVDPASLMAALEARCRDLGVHFVTGSRAKAVRDLDAHAELQIDDRSMTAGVLVLAAGARTRELARGLGIDLPLRGGRGYGFDFSSTCDIRRPLYLADHKVAVTPMTRGLRAAGLMEFGRDANEVDLGRGVRVEAALPRYFRSWDPGVSTRWSALRPMTPDGLPMIGRLPTRSRIFVAAGHAMLGVTLGPATGCVMRQLVLDGTLPEVARPFDPLRFRRVRRRSTRS